MNFVFFSPIGWDNMEGAHRPVRFASELARRAHRVIYVQLEKSHNKPRTTNLRVYDLEELGIPEPRVLTAYYGLDYGSLDEARATLAQILDTFHPPSAARVAIFSAPFRPFLEFVELLRAREYLIVFDVLDDYTAMRELGYFCYDGLADQFLAQNCDLAVPLSVPLFNKLQAYGAPRVSLVKDGVDVETFRPKNSDPVQLQRGVLTLGFWGWIWAYNLDVVLLAQLAQARPAWEIHLIGPYDESVQRALNIANIHFHGQVPRARLRAYADQFDVCLLPLPNDAFNQARDPLKVYEYLACHKPVVATHQPQLAELPGVYLSRDADEFIAQVERAAREPLDTAQLDEFLAQQTWTTRVDALLHALNETPRRATTDAQPPRGAMPGAEHEPERWRAYAQHLEKLVAAREAQVADLERALAESGVLNRLKRVVKR